MTNEEFGERFKERVKEFVVRATKLYRALPKTGEAVVFGHQFIRASSSVGANYWAACRARSPEEFFSKISQVVKEADETCFWLEIIIDTELLSKERVAPLLKEAYEILFVVAKARKNTHSKTNKKHFPKT